MNLSEEKIECGYELDECPFCHEPGYLFRKPLWVDKSQFNNRYVYFCGCGNPECNVKPHTKLLVDMGNEEKLVIMDSVRAWNNR